MFTTIGNGAIDLKKIQDPKLIPHINIFCLKSQKDIYAEFKKRLPRLYKNTPNFFQNSQTCRSHRTRNLFPHISICYLKSQRDIDIKFNPRLLKLCKNRPIFFQNSQTCRSRQIFKFKNPGRNDTKLNAGDFIFHYKMDQDIDFKISMHL